MSVFTNAHCYWKQLTSGTVNRQIFGAAVSIGVITLVVKFVGFIKDVVVARAFGINADLDAFILAFSLISFPLGVVFYALQSSFIPVFAQLEKLRDNLGLRRLLGGTVIFCVAIMTVTIVVMVSTLPWLLNVLAYGFSLERREVVLAIVWQLFPFFFLAGLNMLAHGVLQAGKRFWLSSIVPVCIPSATIIMLLVNGTRPDITLLIYGTVFGAVAEFIVLQAALARKGFSMKPLWGPVTPEMKRVFTQTAALIGGTLMMGSNTLIDQAFASTLDAGSIAALNYGNKIPSFFSSLAATALATAILPYFSDMVTNRNWDDCRHTLKKYGELLLLVAIPATILIITTSKPIIQVMFERGAFNSHATNLVANIQRLYMLQIPCYLIGILAIRFISAMGKNQILTVISGINLIANIAFDWWFMRLWGVCGIALATSIVYFLSAILCIISVYRLFRHAAPRINCL